VAWRARATPIFLNTPSDPILYQSSIKIVLDGKALSSIKISSNWGLIVVCSQEFRDFSGWSSHWVPRVSGVLVGTVRFLIRYEFSATGTCIGFPDCLD
jgi:hypothetical protein